MHHAFLDEVQDGAGQYEPSTVDDRLWLMWLDPMPSRVQHLAHHLDDGGVEGGLIEKLASAWHHLGYHDWPLHSFAEQQRIYRKARLLRSPNEARHPVANEVPHDVAPRSGWNDAAPHTTYIVHDTTCVSTLSTAQLSDDSLRRTCCTAASL